MAIKQPKERLMDFLGDIDYHGPRRVMRSGGWCRAIFWLIVLLLLLALFLFDISSKIMFYLEYPTATSTTIQRHKELQFPAVTVCNKNYVMRSNTQMFPGQQTDVLASVAANNPDVNRSFVGQYVMERGYRQNWVIPEVSCRMFPSNTVINCSEFEVSSRQIFPYGNCFTLNSEGGLKARRPGQTAAMQFDVNTDPNADTTGVVGPRPDGVPVRVIPQDGVTNAQLVRYRESMPDLFPTATRGVVLLLHHPDAEPDFLRPDADIMELLLTDKNQEFRLAITPSEVRRLAPPFSDCEPKRSQAGCDKQCVARHVLKKEPNCTMYDLPTQSTSDSEVLCNDGQLDKYTAALLEAKRECCRPRCRTTTYDVTTTAVAGARDAKYVTVKMFYKRSEMTVTEERVVMTAAALLGSMAISMLIFIGVMPCISLAHLLEFLVDLVCACCCGKRGDGSIGDVEEGSDERPSSSSGQNDE